MYFDSNQKISSNFSIIEMYLRIIPPIQPFLVFSCLSPLEACPDGCVVWGIANDC